MSENPDLIEDSSNIANEDSDISTLDENGNVVDTSAPKGTPDDKLATRISDTEAKLKEVQKELTLAQMERARLEGENNVLKKTDESKTFVDPLESNFDPDEFNLNPADGIRNLLKQERSLMASLFKARDEELKSELRSILKDEVNPDRLAMKDVIEELKGNAWFDKLTASEQVEAAKQFKSVNKSKNSIKVPGSPAGTGRIAPIAIDPAKAEKELEARATALFGDLSSDKLEPLIA